MTRCLGAVLALTLVLASSAAGAAPQSLQVLFVGNSLRATNDLPAYVAGLADASARRMEYRTIAVGGYSLEDHWNLGEAKKALASRTWDVVVMQQGPSALPESGLPALLTVWPESYRQDALPDVIASYRRAAGAAGAELLPAGLAWQHAWQCGRRLGLYGGDGFHPSPLGTYAAALVVYGRLFRAPLRTPKLELVGVPARTSRLLQAAAARALGQRVPAARRCGH
jgi:hypothetical protein